MSKAEGHIHLRFEQTEQRMFGEFAHAAGTWDTPRRASSLCASTTEHGERGANPRVIVTDLSDSAKALRLRLRLARPVMASLSGERCRFGRGGCRYRRD